MYRIWNDKILNNKNKKLEVHTLMRQKDNPTIFNRYFNARVAAESIAWLNKNGFTPEQHETIYMAALSHPLEHAEIRVGLVLQEHAGSLLNRERFYQRFYRKNSRNSNKLIKCFFNISAQKLSQDVAGMIVKAVHAAANPATLSYGPLEKMPATKNIEMLLIELAQLKSLKTVKVINEHNDIYLFLPSDKQYNLSLLLRNADLIHITFRQREKGKGGTATLDEEHMAQLWKLIEPFIKLDTESRESSAYGNLATKLPRAVLCSIRAYTGNRYYKKLNGFFRGETDALEEKDILLYFIMGSLITLGLNWMQATQDNNSSAMYYFSRKEALKKSEIDGRIKQSIAKLPALTSTSVTNDKISTLRFGDTQTFFKNPMSREYLTNQVSLYGNENEVILPPGTQVQYKRWHENILCATIVNTPDYQRDQILQESALMYAYKNYLSQAYPSEQPDKNNIPRANHGLAHTYRAMNYIELAIYYFSQYAKDAGFKSYCSNISVEDLQWLQIAMAFSVVGRVDELSFHENPIGYAQAKKRNRLYLVHYLNISTILPAGDNKEAMIERLGEAVQYFGNPQYSRDINKHPNASEKLKRNYITRLIAFAHDLDLMRCLKAKKFTLLIKQYDQDVIDNPQQLALLSEIINYAANEIIQHGGGLYCKPEGAADNLHFVNVAPYFINPRLFKVVSKNLTVLRNNSVSPVTVINTHRDSLYQSPQHGIC